MFNFNMKNVSVLENESPRFYTTEDVYKSLAAKKNTELAYVYKKNSKCAMHYSTI